MTDNTKNNKTVLVGGCFDILHFGHVHFLKEAKKLGKLLVVALESDENVSRRKGQLRPIHSQEKRKETLESLRFVDRVLPLPTMTTNESYDTLVHDIHPDIIAITQGDPYKKQKEKQATAVGATVVEIPKIHTYSTSQLAKLLGID